MAVRDYPEVFEVVAWGDLDAVVAGQAEAEGLAGVGVQVGVELDGVGGARGAENHDLVVFGQGADELEGVGADVEVDLG